MTRGTLYLLLQDSYISTTEFNGDMYPRHYGNQVFRLLDFVKDADSFKEVFTAFNAATFEYNEELFYSGRLKEIKDNADMSDYSSFWFSDYVFIKNLSHKDMKFTVVGEGGEKVKYVLKHGEKVRFNFGNIVDEKEAMLESKASEVEKEVKKILSSTKIVDEDPNSERNTLKRGF